MKHQLIPVWFALFKCLNSLLIGWIQLTRPLICPHCFSQSCSPWGYYDRLWKVSHLAINYQWRVRRLRCEGCRRTFSRYTKTRWAYSKYPPGLGLVVCGFRLADQMTLNQRKNRPKTKTGIFPLSNMAPPVDREERDVYLRALQFVLASCLNEVQRRLVVALEALQQGKEGIHRLHEWTGMAKKTIRRGIREVVNQKSSVQWGHPLRRSGGGRKRVDEDVRVGVKLEELLKDETAGDPITDLKWVRKTLRKLAQALADQDIQVSPNTVRRMLRDRGYSLKVNSKRQAFNAKHPLRNEQFEYIAYMKARFIKAGNPVISIDTKKKELIGQFTNPGQTWRQDPYETWDHDFSRQAVGKLIPYGIYDLALNRGYIYAGTHRATSEFATDALAFWWRTYGRQLYPNAQSLLILCDCGGAESCTSHVWKWDVQEKLADPFGLALYVCHYPPGTSKWNPIEHKLFSYISLNWAGKPLTSYEVALNYMRTTTTQAGLQVAAVLSETSYQTGREIPDQLLDTINQTSQTLSPHPVWNYVIAPRDEFTLQLRIQIQEALDKPAPPNLPPPPPPKSQPYDPAVRSKPSKKPDSPVSYSVQQAAKQLSVCIKTIHRWEQAGKITCSRTAGNHRRIPPTEIQRIRRLREAGKG